MCRYIEFFVNKKFFDPKNAKMKISKENLYLKNMQTTQEFTKKDYVVEALSALVEQYYEDKAYATGDEGPDPVAAKYMLFGNPNGSSLFGDLPYAKDLKDIVNNISSLSIDELTNPNSDKCFPILPTKSVSISSRVSLTISELVKRLELVNVLNIRLIMRELRGTSDPIMISGGSVKLMHRTIIQMNAGIKYQLIDQLPGIINIAYQAKYENTGAFTYSLAEIKPFPVRREFLQACFSKIMTFMSLPAMGQHAADDFTHEMDPANPKNFLELEYEAWMKFSRNFERKSRHVPPAYEKLAKVICARVGKFMIVGSKDPSIKHKDLSSAARAQMGATDSKFDNTEVDKSVKDILIARCSAASIEQLFPGFYEQLARDEIDPKVKKDFQIALKERLISELGACYAVVPQKAYATLELALSKDAPAGRYNLDYSRCKSLIAKLLTFAGSLDVNLNVVYGGSDGLNLVAPRHQLKDVLAHILSSAQGDFVLANTRIMNSIYSFLAVHDQAVLSKAGRPIPPRRLLDQGDDHSVENALIHSMNATKVSPKSGDDKENALVFHPSSLAAHGQSNGIAAKYSSVTDGGKVGFLQRAVMTITSAVSDRSAIPVVDVDVQQISSYGNDLDLYASRYEQLMQKKYIAANKLRHSKSTAVGTGISDNVVHQHLHQPVSHAHVASPAPSQAQIEHFPDVPVAHHHATHVPHVEHEVPAKHGMSSLFETGASPVESQQLEVPDLPLAGAPRSPLAGASAGLFGATQSAASPRQTQAAGLFGATQSGSSSPRQTVANPFAQTSGSSSPRQTVANPFA